MSPICIDPEAEEAVVEESVVEETVRFKDIQPEPEADTPESKQRIRNLLFRIFAGHEEFLGWTPD